MTPMSEVAGHVVRRAVRDLFRGGLQRDRPLDRPPQIRWITYPQLRACSAIFLMCRHRVSREEW